MMKKIAKRLQMLMDEAGLGNNDFAKSIGVTQGCMSNWMNCRNYISVSCLAQVCNTYHVSADWVLGLSEER